MINAMQKWGVMNKIIISIGGIAIACVIPILCAKSLTSSTNADSIGNRVGEIVQDQLDERGKIVAQGNGIKVYENEVTLRVSLSQFTEVKQTSDDVTDRLIEEKVLYNKATEAGIKIEETQLDAEIEKLKSCAYDESVDNHKILEGVLDSFEDEDQYWEYVKERNRITETIAAYENDITQTYAKKNDLDVSSQDDQKMIEKYIQEVKNQLVEEADVKIMN